MNDQARDADSAKGRRPVANVFVGVVGVALLIVAVVGSDTGVTEGIVTCACAGPLLVVAAGVLGRHGKLEIGPSGAKLSVFQRELAVAEHQANRGEVIDAKTIDASGNIEIEATPTAEAEVTPGGDITVETPQPRVVLANVAAEELALFSPAEREAIVAELPNVGSNDENEYGLRWGMQPNEQYRALRVGDDIRIYFRQREKTTVSEPDSFVVLGFQKNEPLEPRQERLGRIPMR